MLNLINVLDITNTEQLCAELGPILRIVGIVILGIKIAVPIILIIVGMIDLAKAVTEKKEENIKAAENALIKKAIAAVLVFLVATIVGVIMTIVGSDDYKKCTACINHPFRDCKASFDIDSEI